MIGHVPYMLAIININFYFKILFGMCNDDTQAPSMKLGM